MISSWFHVIPCVGKNKVVKLVTVHESHRSDSTNSSVLFLHSRAKNSQHDVGLRFYKTVYVTLMTKKWPGNIHASARSGYDMQEITSATTRNDRELFNKIFWGEDFAGESRRLMGLRVVNVRLRPGGDSMQSMSHGESRHIPFFPPICKSYVIFFWFWTLNLISKRLLWFQRQWKSSDSTNDLSHCLTFLPAPPQYSKHISRHIFSFGVTLGSKCLHLSWSRITMLWPVGMLVGMKMWWTIDLCNLNVKLFFKARFSSIRTEGGCKTHTQSRKKGLLSGQSHISAPFLSSEEFHSLARRRPDPSRLSNKWNQVTEVLNRLIMQKHFAIAIAF